MVLGLGTVLHHYTAFWAQFVDWKSFIRIDAYECILACPQSMLGTSKLTMPYGIRCLAPRLVTKHT